MELREKLINIQNELKAPKNQYNSFGKYYYRNNEDILESAKPILLKYKTTLIVQDELMLVGNRYYVKAVATIYDCESTETITACAYAREEEDKKGMDSSQITGATSSYARKYALNGLFLIDDTKDTDSEQYQQQANQGTKTTTRKSSATTKQTIPQAQQYQQPQAPQVQPTQTQQQRPQTKAQTQYDLLTNKLIEYYKTNDTAMNFIQSALKGRKLPDVPLDERNWMLNEIETKIISQGEQNGN